MGENDWRPFVYGGLSSCTAEFGTFPIDTTKTRLQIQGQKLDGRFSAVRYNGMFHALVRISNEEGIRALYFGLGPALLRQSTYGTIKFGVYYSLKSKIMDNKGTEDMMTNIFCGAVAGAVSSAIANPTDVLKVRMQACSSSHLRRKTLLQCFGEIYSQEGITGLWRGVVPTAQRAAVLTAVELPIYDICKHRLIQSEIVGDTPSNHFISSFIASLGGAVASTPIDVVRVRLMNQRRLKSGVQFGFGMSSDFSRQKPRIYRGTIDCLIQTVRYEGIMALYKGFVPTWLRMGPWNVIFFISYEQLKRLY